ncbi:hypothetical protein WDU94_011943 [Cyamophila willieti]
MFNKTILCFEFCISSFDVKFDISIYQVKVRRDPGVAKTSEKTNNIDLYDDYETYFKKQWKKDEEEYIKKRDEKKKKPDHFLYMMNAWDRLKQTESTESANVSFSTKRLTLLVKEMEEYWKREEAKGNTARIKERQKKAKLLAELKEWDEEFKRKWKEDEEAYEREINKPTPRHIQYMNMMWAKLEKSVSTEDYEKANSTKRLTLLVEKMEKYWEREEARGNTERIKKREEKAKLSRDLKEWDDEFKRQWRKDEEKYERERTSNKTTGPRYMEYMQKQWDELRDSGSTNRLQLLSDIMNTYWQKQELLGYTEKVQERMDLWTKLAKLRDYDMAFRKQWKEDEEAYERAKNKKKIIPDHIEYMSKAWEKLKEKTNTTKGSTSRLKALGELMEKYWEQQEKAGNTYRIKEERDKKEAWRKKGEELMREIRIQNDPVKLEERRREKERIEEEKRKKIEEEKRRYEIAERERFIEFFGTSAENRYGNLEGKI